MFKNIINNNNIMDVKNYLPIDILFNSLNITHKGNNFSFKIDSESVSRLDDKIKFQKVMYIIKSKNMFDVDKVVNKEINFTWYIRGVYSTSFADIYYDIANYKELLGSDQESVEKVKAQYNNSIEIVNEFMNNFFTIFEITSEEKINYYLEFVSSIIFIKNELGYSGDKIKNFLLKHKPKFTEEYDDLINKTNKLLL